ncbi:unnamed protein product [Notodromas monacha]|uniref:Uncharacterized protein n=1 Tax=Notodromas monacha TaxID=399045 RepID=A0A7R9GBA3_9CRUS|nr:unnamed protein product [Notodromas monacha]CAG0914810.1 unnamed protein product [Notodromas monacha]
MLKFIRGKGHQPSAERVRLQKLLFKFRKTVQHGFPGKPSALAYDPSLSLLAVGTKFGAIKMYPFQFSTPSWLLLNTYRTRLLG